MLKMFFYGIGLIILLTSCDDCTNDFVNNERSLPHLSNCHEIKNKIACNELSHCAYFENACLEKTQVQELERQRQLSNFADENDAQVIKAAYDKGIFKPEDAYGYIDPLTEEHKEGNFITAALMTSKAFIPFYDEETRSFGSTISPFYWELHKLFERKLFQEFLSLNEENSKKFKRNHFVDQLNNSLNDDKKLIELYADILSIEDEDFNDILRDFFNQHQEKKYLLPKALSRFYHSKNVDFTEEDAKAVLNGAKELPNLSDEDPEKTQEIRDLIARWQTLKIPL